MLVDKLPGADYAYHIKEALRFANKVYDQYAADDTDGKASGLYGIEYVVNVFDDNTDDFQNSNHFAELKAAVEKVRPLLPKKNPILKTVDLRSLSDDDVAKMTKEEIEACIEECKRMISGAELTMKNYTPDDSLYRARQHKITALNQSLSKLYNSTINETAVDSSTSTNAERGANKPVKFNQALDNHPDARRIAAQRVSQQAKLDEEERLRKEEKRSEEEKQKEAARFGNIVMSGLCIVFLFVIHAVFAPYFYGEFLSIHGDSPLNTIFVLSAPLFIIGIIAGIIKGKLNMNTGFLLILIAAYVIIMFVNNPYVNEAGYIVFFFIVNGILGIIATFVGFAIGKGIAKTILK